MNLNGVKSRWLKMQKDLIAAQGHTATIYYRTIPSGPAVGFDSWYNEGLNPNLPNSFSGSNTQKTSVIVSGIAYLDVAGMNNDQMDRLRIGWFESGTSVFTCLIADATVNGKFVFKDSEYVNISVDGCNYVVSSWTMDDIGPYVYHIVLKKTNLGV